MKATIFPHLAFTLAICVSFCQFRLFFICLIAVSLFPRALHVNHVLRHSALKLKFSTNLRLAWPFS